MRFWHIFGLFALSVSLMSAEQGAVGLIRPEKAKDFGQCIEGIKYSGLFLGVFMYLSIRFRLLERLMWSATWGTAAAVIADLSLEIAGANQSLMTAAFMVSFGSVTASILGIDLLQKLKVFLKRTRSAT